VPDPSVPPAAPVLEVEGISLRFGGLQALKDVSLQVGEYEIVGLIGPNGAGKTTAFNCVTGFYKPNEGRIAHRGHDVTAMAPYQRAARGLGRTFQNVGMVKGATALDNLLTAQHVHAGYGSAAGILGTGTVRTAEAQLTHRADAVLDLLGLQEIRDKRVGGLPYGTLKLLEVGCALATDPDVLLLDEPSSGMGPEEAHALGDRLLALRKQLGLTILLIEHHVPLVTRVCDHVYVLVSGQLLVEGDPETVRAHPEVISAYLGTPVEAVAATPEHTEELLEAKHQREAGARRAPACRPVAPPSAPPPVTTPRPPRPKKVQP